jgi:hypothetical protein
MSHGERKAQCPDEDAFAIQSIEVSFGAEVIITQDQQRRLYDLITEVVRSPWNQFEGCVHWLSGYGSKILWSARDAAFLGVHPSDNPSPDGEEPSSDDTVLCFTTTCRDEAPTP